jgi:type I restriction enzyme M protein
MCGVIARIQELIDDLSASAGESARREREALRTAEKAISAIESRIKTARANLKAKADELAFKLQLKRLGAEGFTAETRETLAQLEAELGALDTTKKEDHKRKKDQLKDQATLERRLGQVESVLAAIGGQLTEAEARELILKKLLDLVRAEMDRYVGMERRGLVQAVEHLWEKYAVSTRDLEGDRQEILESLDGYLRGLGYMR